MYRYFDATQNFYYNTNIINIREMIKMTNLDIESFSKIFDNKSESYKLFWFKSILNKVVNDEKIISYDSLVNEMISEVWKPVTKYNLSLGQKDSLELVTRLIYSNSSLNMDEDKDTVLEFLSKYYNDEVFKYKNTIIRFVPYRLLAPFVPEIKGERWRISKDILFEILNDKENVLYYFGDYNGLQTHIFINDNWFRCMREHKDIIYRWINLNILNYLQKCNCDKNVSSEMLK